MRTLVTFLFGMQGFGAGLVPVVGLYLSLQEAERQRKEAELQRKREPQALYKAAGARLAESVADSEVPSSTPLLERELEKDLRRVYHRVTGKYNLVVGPRGCGKTSTAVAAACERRDGTTLTPRPGVLLLKADNKGDAVHLVLRALAPKDATKAAFDDMVKEANLDTLTPVFKAAIEAHKSQVVAKAKGDKSSEPAASDDDGWVPTVIIEVDRNLEPKDVADVCRVAKHLACEQRIAAVVLVLSDAGTTGIPPDLTRQARAHMSAVVLGWPVFASVLVLVVVDWLLSPVCCFSASCAEVLVAGRLLSGGGGCLPGRPGTAGWAQGDPRGEARGVQPCGHPRFNAGRPGEHPSCH
jgi:hypothetical protein